LTAPAIIKFNQQVVSVAVYLYTWKGADEEVDSEVE
jgi:hypothetical protein